MDESTAAKCCVCHKSSYWFYENISALQSRQSTRTIPVILKLIMGEELSIDWVSSGAMCFECVDKINDYDEAFEKMQLIERELKRIHKVTRVKLENEGFFSMNANAICDGDAMAFDVTIEDFTSENFADPLNYAEELMQPQSIESSEENQKNHGENAKSEFDCEYCGLALNNSIGLKIHISRVHKDSMPAECPICRKIFPTAQHAENHRMTDTCKSTDVTCPICQESFRTMRCLSAHMSKHNRKNNMEPPFDCEFCGVTFDDHDKLNKHKELHRNLPRYKCFKCDYIGKTTNLLKQHMRSHTRWNEMSSVDSINRLEFSCNRCPQSYSEERYLKNHMRNAHHISLPSPLECVLCGIEVDTPDELDEHIARHSSRLEYQCIECQYIGSATKLLKQHMRSHTRWHQCSVCGKGLINEALLQKHMDRHDKGEISAKLNEDHSGPGLQFPCNLCPKSYSELRYLKTHMRHAHKILTSSPLECEFCGLELDTSVELDEHKSQHSTRLQYQCVECEYTGSATKLLRQHMRSHTRWNQCDLCGKGLISASALQEHMNKHESGEIVEKLADENDAEESGSNSHIQTPTDPSDPDQSVQIQTSGNSTNRLEFPCNRCPQNYLEERYLKVHMKNAHKILLSSPLECGLCGIEEDTPDELDEHISLHSNRLEYQCVECEYVGSATKLLRQHMRSHTRWNYCDLCNKGLINETSLRKHMNKHEKGELVDKFIDENRAKPKSHSQDQPNLPHPAQSSSNQNQASPNIESLLVELEMKLDTDEAESVKAVKCKECKETFDSVHGLKIHKARIHVEPGSLKCSVCHKTFKRKFLLMRHMAADSSCNRMVFACKLCPKRFSGLRYLKSHIVCTHKILTSSPLECEFCGIELDTSEQLDEHKSHHSNRLHHQCVECEYIGAARSFLRQHMHSHTRWHQCSMCGKGLINAAALRKHKKIHGTDLKSECYICKYRTISARKLREHMRIQHTGAKPYKCSKCDKVYACKNHLKNHFSFHSEPQSGNGDSQFDCDKCGKTYQTEHSLKIHKGNVHKGGGGLKCPLCPAKFANKRNLKLHEERHVARIKYYELNQIQLQCELCEKRFSNPAGLNRHISRFHREIGRFECMVCHKFYPNKHLLQKHIGSATCRERNFKCEICTKQFTLPHNYKEHMRMHNVSTEMEPPFYCDYCRLEFEDYQALCVHKELHLNRPDFECVICDYKTDKKLNLQAHTRIHREVGHRHICDVCGKFFKSRELLLVHLKYHTDDLHIECYICKWRALSTSKMQEHMRKHTGEKPFPCTECGKRFSRNANMRTHLRLHFGPSEKRHKCTVCEATFTRTGKLSEHYLKEHGLNVKPTTNRLIKVKR